MLKRTHAQIVKESIAKQNAKSAKIYLLADMVLIAFLAPY